MLLRRSRVIPALAALLLAPMLLPTDATARVPELPYCLPLAGTVVCSTFVNTSDCFEENGVRYCQTIVFFWWTKATPI